MAECRNAQCHCGAVAFTVALTDGLNTARRCSCSFCRMRGAVVVSAPLSVAPPVRWNIPACPEENCATKEPEIVMGLVDLRTWPLPSLPGCAQNPPLPFLAFGAPYGME